MSSTILNIDPYKVPSPSFVVDEAALKKNLSVLEYVQKKTKVKILLALKGFAMFSTFPLIREVLHGICASSPNEARLGREEFKREVHSFAAAYSETDVKELLTLSDHLVFNSFSQWDRFNSILSPYIENKKIEFGLRVNPEHSETAVAIYDPCASYSRLGITLNEFHSQVKNNPAERLKGISGLHFHTLCQKDSFALERTLKVFDEKFSPYFKYLKWLNFGGGHHITRADYDVDHLVSLLNKFQTKYENYNLQLYLEPGEAIALNTGVLVATVLDVINNDKRIAILDVSAVAHMPDVLEMPYRPEIVFNQELAGVENEFNYSYRLAGLSCLAGDVVGDYSFKTPLNVGDKLMFLDMAHYSMVKTTNFNGLKLPSIVLYKDNEARVIREFGYLDYKSRLS